MSFVIEHRYRHNNYNSWPHIKQCEAREEMEQYVRHLVHCLSHVTAVAVNDKLAWSFPQQDDGWNQQWIQQHPSCIEPCNCSSNKMGPLEYMLIKQETNRQNFIDEHGFSL